MSEEKTSEKEAFDFAWQESDREIDAAIEANLLSIRKKEVLAETLGRKPETDNSSAREKADLLARYRETIKQMFQKSGRTTPLSQNDVFLISVILVVTKEAEVKSALYHFFEKKEPVKINEVKETAKTGRLSEENIAFTKKAIDTLSLEVNRQLSDICMEIEQDGSTAERESKKSQLVYDSKKMPLLADFVVNMCKTNLVTAPLDMGFLKDILRIMEGIESDHLNDAISEYVAWFNHKAKEAQRNQETACAVLSKALFMIVRSTKAELPVVRFIPAFDGDDQENPAESAPVPDWLTAEDVANMTDCLTALSGDVGRSFALYFELCKKYCQMEESGQASKADFEQLEKKISPVGDIIRTQVIPKRRVELLLKTIQEHAKNIARTDPRK